MKREGINFYHHLLKTHQNPFGQSRDILFTSRLFLTPSFHIKMVFKPANITSLKTNKQTIASPDQKKLINQRALTIKQRSGQRPIKTKISSESGRRPIKGTLNQSHRAGSPTSWAIEKFPHSHQPHHQSWGQWLPKPEFQVENQRSGIPWWDKQKKLSWRSQWIAESYRRRF